MPVVHCGVNMLSQPQPELATARPSLRTFLFGWERNRQCSMLKELPFQDDCI